MIEISEKKLSEWEALVKAATPGPWEVRRNAGNHWGMREVFGPMLRILGFTVATDVTLELAGQIESDCDFIAASRTAVPELIREVRRMNDIKATMQRIQHYASGTCDMAAETRLKLINRECECELTKSHGRVFGPIPADEGKPTEGTEPK